MKIIVPESAVKILKEIMAENTDKPSCVRVYFAGMG